MLENYKKSKNKESYILRISLIILCFIFFNLVLVANLLTVKEQQFSYLAKSLLSGKTYFVEQLETWNDTVPLENRHYWPLGPFPAIILMPFVALFRAIGIFFYQGYLQFFLVIAVFRLVFMIARKCMYTIWDSLFLAFAFCAASAFLVVAVLPLSWYFSHVITVTLLFLILNEYLGKKRYWLIGTMVALILLTRLPAAFVIVFFIIEILFLYKNTLSKKINDVATLVTPCFIGLFFFFIYNYVRFGNFFEQGYSLQLLQNILSEARDRYGLLSLRHIPEPTAYTGKSLLSIYKLSYANI